MIPENILRQTFRLKNGKDSGTCFTIIINGRQYIISAKHLFKDWDSKRAVEIYHEKRWKKIDSTVVGQCEEHVDIIVLAASSQISVPFPVACSHKGIVTGQDVYFLGFPYGLSGEMAKINGGYPLSLVKKAIVSGMYPLESREGFLILLDGHNNKGFSGGPIIFKEPGSNEYKIAAVISGYHSEPEPIYEGEKKLPATYNYNTGIIESYGIDSAIELIKNNPIGFVLP